MKPAPYRTNPARFAALACMAVLIPLSALPKVDAGTRKALAARFAFERFALPTVSEPHRNVLPVHPALAHISGWVSAVGAGVALADLDGDGLSNDLCLTEPRTGRVVVAPTPGGTRYSAFELAQPTGTWHGGATRCLVGDFNEDGHADLMVTYFGRSPSLHLRQPAIALSPGAFAISELIDGAPEMYTATALLVDLDTDGHTDVVLGNYFQDDSHMYDPSATNVVELQDSFSHAFNGGANRVFLWTANTGEGAAFREVDAFTDKQARAWTLAAGAADLDLDGKVDLYIANDYGPDGLFRNDSEPGNVKLTPLFGRDGIDLPSSKVIGHDSFKGMGVDFGDVNGDGHFDIFVSNIAAKWALQEAHFLWVSTDQMDRFAQGVAPYADQGEPLGVGHSDWGWDTRFGDFDNDGVLEMIQATGFRKGEVNKWPELAEFAIGNDNLVHRPALWPRVVPGDEISGHEHNPFYVLDERTGRYADVAVELGIAAPEVSRGIATADVDGDGDLDWAIANQWETSWFFRNDAPSPGAFLGLHVLRSVDPAATTEVRKGHPSNGEGWPALGATVSATLPDGSTRLGHVDASSGHTGSRSPDIHFGLGQLPLHQPIEVSVRWRDGTGTHLEALTLTPGWHTVVLATTPGGAR